MSHFGISRDSQFLYFRVRSALKLLKVPSGADLGIHPLISLIEKAPHKKTVSYVYNNLLSYIPAESSERRSWEADIHLGTETIDWDTVWENVFRSTKNPNQQISFKVAFATSVINKTLATSSPQGDLPGVVISSH